MISICGSCFFKDTVDLLEINAVIEGLCMDGLYRAGCIISAFVGKVHMLRNLIPRHDKACAVRAKDRRSRIGKIRIRIIADGFYYFFRIVAGTVAAKEYIHGALSRSIRS